MGFEAAMATKLPEAARPWRSADALIYDPRPRSLRGKRAPKTCLDQLDNRH